MERLDGRGDGEGTEPHAPLVIAHLPRDRTRRVLRTQLSRRHGRVVITRTHDALAAHLHAQLVDAVIVDLGASGDAPLRGASLARDYPSIAFLAMTPLRPVDAPAVAQCADVAVADVLVDGVDDALLRHAVATHGFSARFRAALRTPPPALALTTELQLATWHRIVDRAGRVVRTHELARELSVTREHLSRSFANGSGGGRGGGGATLKRVIDLVRLLAAAELAKNPGYALGDVARLLGYPSLARLSGAAQRLVGTGAKSLSALRAVDLVERFVRHGTGR